jgi:hypothetical protein
MAGAAAAGYIGPSVHGAQGPISPAGKSPTPISATKEMIDDIYKDLDSIYTELKIPIPPKENPQGKLPDEVAVVVNQKLAEKMGYPKDSQIGQLRSLYELGKETSMSSEIYTYARALREGVNPDIVKDIKPISPQKTLKEQKNSLYMIGEKGLVIENTTAGGPTESFRVHIEGQSIRENLNLNGLKEGLLLGSCSADSFLALIQHIEQKPPSVSRPIAPPSRPKVTSFPQKKGRKSQTLPPGASPVGTKVTTKKVSATPGAFPTQSISKELEENKNSFTSWGGSKKQRDRHYYGLIDNKFPSGPVAIKAQNQLEEFAISNGEWDDTKIARNLTVGKKLGKFTYIKTVDNKLTVSSPSKSETVDLIAATRIGLGGDCTKAQANLYLTEKHNPTKKPDRDFYKNATQLAIRTTTIKQFEVRKVAEKKWQLTELSEPKKQDILYATFPNAKHIKSESEYKKQVMECLEGMRNAMDKDEILSLPIPGAFMPRDTPSENGKYRALFLDAVNEFCDSRQVPILVHTVNQVDYEARAGGRGNDEKERLTSPYALIAPDSSDMDVNHFTLLEKGYKVVTMITADPVAHSGNGAKGGLGSAAQAADERGSRLGPAQLVVTDPNHNPAIFQKLTQP